MYVFVCKYLYRDKIKENEKKERNAYSFDSQNAEGTTEHKNDTHTERESFISIVTMAV